MSETGAAGLFDTPVSEVGSTDAFLARIRAVVGGDIPVAEALRKLCEAGLIEHAILLATGLFAKNVSGSPAVQPVPAEERIVACRVEEVEGGYRLVFESEENIYCYLVKSEYITACPVPKEREEGEVGE